MISVDDALSRALEGLTALEVETVPTVAASGRVLAETLTARLTQPPFDASAMDGYAVRREDLRSLPRTLEVIGESAAGSGFDGALGPGQAVRIFTGAPVPKGADTIVIQEDTEAHDGAVTVNAVAGSHIRPRGQDFREGEVILTEGTRLGARDLMLAATTNCAALPVRRKPRVAILATGDELLAPGTPLGKDQIVASVSSGIAPLVEAEGGQAEDLGIGRDNLQSICDHIRKARGSDILVTVGGASVGARDLVKQALAHEGFDIAFSKVAMRPGKPVFSGRLGQMRVLGVPGNPVSALVCCYIFLVPMLRALLGLPVRDRTATEAVLGASLPENGPRQHYMRATSRWGDDGARIVQPLPSQDSSLVAALAKADCLIIQPPKAPKMPRGMRVKVLPFGHALSP